jgi:hypothetical protein
MEDAYLQEQIVQIKIPLAVENLREELSFYKELRHLFKEHDKSIEDIDFIISNIEANISIFSRAGSIVIDEEKMLNQIEKHPYFKNPCDYPIRLITVLKYLKAKGHNMNYKDIDLYVDKLIQKIDGVHKVGRGLYQKTR